jgi:hypothetical protein
MDSEMAASRRSVLARSAAMIAARSSCARGGSASQRSTPCATAVIHCTSPLRVVIRSPRFLLRSPSGMLSAVWLLTWVMFSRRRREVPSQAQDPLKTCSLGLEVATIKIRALEMV